ncbi:MAG: hypothetical protein ACJA13_001084 [Paraglaciecola sp.]|jgi:hypothetical protein
MIMRCFLLIVCSLMMTACASSKQAQSVNVMIAVDDSSENAVPADFSSVKRLVTHVAGELSDAGIKVYDETSLGLDDFSFAQGQRNKVSLLDMARSIKQVKLDHVVLLTAQATVQDKGHTTSVATHVVGSVIQVNSGRVEGSFADSGRKQNANGDCSLSCLNDTIGQSLVSAAGNIGAIIVSTLPAVKTSHTLAKVKKEDDSRQSSQDWVLVFDGFNPQDMLQIEEYLVIFTGYQNMRYLSSRYTYAEIWYTSGINSAKLNRNLKRMFSEINKRAMISQEGNRFAVKKISLGVKDDSKFDLVGW